MPMHFLPGDRKRRKPTGGRVVFGGSYNGPATPSNLVPYEEPKKRAKPTSAAQDVADAYDMVKRRPNTSRDYLRKIRSELE